MNFGLSANVLTLLQNIFKKYPQIHSVKLFGSRAMGNYRYNSDIDLAFWGDIDQRLLARLNMELDELPLPYKFDLQIYQEITHSGLLEHIDRFGCLIYSFTK